MKRYLVETSIIVGYLRGKKDVVKFVDELEGEIVSSFVCWAELYEGIYRVKKSQQAGKDVREFFAGLSQVYGLDESIVDNFGKIRAELKQKGKVIEDLDILIAATCLANNLVLVTGNAKHFKRVGELKLVEIT